MTGRLNVTFCDWCGLWLTRAGLLFWSPARLPVTAPCRAREGLSVRDCARRDAGGRSRGAAAVGAMADKLRKGTPADIVVLTAAIIAKLAEENRLVPTSIADIGLVETAIAVRAGDPVLARRSEHCPGEFPVPEGQDTAKGPVQRRRVGTAVQQQGPAARRPDHDPSRA